MSADSNPREVLRVADAARRIDRVLDDVVDGGDAQVAVVQDGVENLGDTPEGGVPDEHLRQHKLAKPVLGHGKME